MLVMNVVDDEWAPYASMKSGIGLTVDDAPAGVLMLILIVILIGTCRLGGSQGWRALLGNAPLAFLCTTLYCGA